VLEFRGHQIEAVGFDLDGTLIASEELNFEAVLETCRVFGVSDRGLTIRDSEGGTNYDIFRRITRRYGKGSARNTEELVHFKRAYYLAHMGRVRAIPGGVALIRALHARGIPCAIATAASRVSLLAALQVLGLEESEFVALVPADVLPAKMAKPNKYHWEEVARLLGIAPGQLLTIEDSRRGLRSATEAGTVSVGLTTTHGEEELRSAGASFIVSSFAELAEILGLSL